MAFSPSEEPGHHGLFNRLGFLLGARRPARSSRRSAGQGSADEAVAFDLEALQVLGEPHLEAGYLQNQIRLLQQFLAVSGVFRPNQDFQQVIQISFDPLSQQEAVISGEFAGMCFV
jgi:hypothetical protein